MHYLKNQHGKEIGRALDVFWRRETKKESVEKKQCRIWVADQICSKHTCNKSFGISLSIESNVLAIKVNRKTKTVCYTHTHTHT